MDKPNFYVITGASGAGKTTLLKALCDRGYSIVPEVALALVQEQEQEQCGGNLFPWTDLEAFMREVLARNVRAYDAARALEPPVFFDRGVPECLGHMRILGLDVDTLDVELSRQRRYATSVFVAEPWPEIYVCDGWRRAPFERTQRSYEPTVAAYVDEGYDARIIPKLRVEDRVAFVLKQLDAGA